jgi:muconate cycloisomerase
MKPGVVNSENYGPGLDPGLANFDKVPKHLIRLHTSDGLTGSGETGRGVETQSVEANAKFLTGRDLLTLDFAQPSLGLPARGSSDAYEIALYDLMGRSLGVPVHTLLGGLHQPKVAVTYWTGQRTEQDYIMIAERALAQGFKHLKIKARRYDPIEKRVAAIDKAAPSLTLTVDFNRSYPDVATFLPVARRLEGFKLTIEDPIRGDLHALRQLRQRSAVPYALTTSSTSVMMEAIRMEAVDMFNLGGPMRTFVETCQVAAAAGIPAWHGSGVELGVRDMSFIQAAAATRSCTVPSDTLCWLRESDLLQQPFKVVDGYIEVPRTPGLGVDFDMDAVRRYQVS